MAQEMLRDMAPLLAEEGIDLDNVPDLETLNRAMARSVERRNLELFSPVGAIRDVAVATLRPVMGAILDGDTVRAAVLLDQVQPESPDNSVATAAKGRAFRSLDKLLVRQGGPQVLSGSALALAAAITAWAQLTDTPPTTLIQILVS